MAARFQIDWLSNPEFKDWVEEIPSDIHSVKCSLCHKKVSLNNMGRRALRSHASGAQHQSRIKASKQSMSLKCFPPAIEGTSNGSTATDKSDGNTVCKHCGKHPNDPPSASSVTPRGLNSFLLKEDVTESEILWCLQTVVTHKSTRMAEKDVALFERMFRDSEVAKKIKLKRSKMGYSINYGIAPFFKTELLKKISKCTFFSVGFDESLNKVSQKNQMDVNVRFWCETDNVCTRYLTSAFLNRSTADEIRQNFKSALSELNIFNMVQISMDGPNVNHRFFKDIKDELMECSEGDQPVILNMGSCGLHVMHGAFKTGIQVTNWSLINFLRCLYNLFKDVPARRALFTQYSKSSKFPLKFYSVRWLQNGKVAQRAIEILPNLSEFISGVKKDKVTVNCASFQKVCSLLEDPLLEAKLTFFISLTAEIEPFLAEYQTDTPLIPFLYGSLQSIVVNIMRKFVKESVLKANTSVHKIDVNKQENLLPADEIDLGYATRSALKKTNRVKKIPDKDVLAFRKDCLACLKSFVLKLLERSPLCYLLTKAVTCFDPLVASNNDFNLRRMKNLLTILEDHKWIDGSTADKAEREYRSICCHPTAIEEFKKFERKNSRVDEFWRNVLKTVDSSDNVGKVMKLVMTLSHGNANVERGFSVNSECLVENLKEETLISQRIVYDTVVSTVGSDVNSFKIPKSLMHAFKNAHSLLKDDMRKRQRESLDNEVHEAQKKKARLITKELEQKMSEIRENANKEINAILLQIDALKQ